MIKIHKEKYEFIASSEDFQETDCLEDAKEDLEASKMPTYLSVDGCLYKKKSEVKK